jgi:hypothetical protein
LPKHKRDKVARGSRRLGKGGLAILIIVLVAGGIVGSFVGYGLSDGAVVDFAFGGANDVRQSYQLTAMSRLQPSTIDITHVHANNTGRTGITVIVTMQALNAAVSTGYYGPYGDTANIQIYLPPASENQIVTFYLTLPSQVRTFTIRVTIGRELDFSSITSLATSGLSRIQSISPTTLVYTQNPASPNSYELTQQY